MGLFSHFKPNVLLVDADQVAVLCTKYVHMNTIMDDADGLMVVRQDQDGIPKWKQKQIFWQNFEPRGMSTVLSDTREKSFTTHILGTNFHVGIQKSISSGWQIFMCINLQHH